MQIVIDLDEARFMCGVCGEDIGLIKLFPSSNNEGDHQMVIEVPKCNCDVEYDNKKK